MVKTISQAFALVLGSGAVFYLLLLDLDWGLILSYVVLALIILGALAFWLMIAVGLICCLWSLRFPRAELTVDGLVISIRYTRDIRGELLVLTGRTSDYTQMKVARAPIAEPIKHVIGELSVNKRGDHPAMLQIEGETFEFPMSKSITRWRYGGAHQSIVTSYSGYFYREKNPDHFVGEVRYAIYHELETSEIIALNQVS